MVAGRQRREDDKQWRRNGNVLRALHSTIGILQMIEVCWTGQGTLSNSIGVGGSTDGSSNDSISL